jgi:hypothetical protein
MGAGAELSMIFFVQFFAVCSPAIRLGVSESSALFADRSPTKPERLLPRRLAGFAT